MAIKTKIFILFSYDEDKFESISTGSKFYLTWVTAKRNIHRGDLIALAEHSNTGIILPVVAEFSGRLVKKFKSPDGFVKNNDRIASLAAKREKEIGFARKLYGLIKEFFYTSRLGYACFNIKNVGSQLLNVSATLRGYWHTKLEELWYNLKTKIVILTLVMIGFLITFGPIDQYLRTIRNADINFNGTKVEVQEIEILDAIKFEDLRQQFTSPAQPSKLKPPPKPVVGIPIALPKATAKALPSDPEEPLVISITADGQITIQNTFVERDELIAKLRAIAVERRSDQVFLRADRTVPYEAVVQVMLAVQSGGFSNIGLVTEPGGSPLGEPAQNIKKNKKNDLSKTIQFDLSYAIAKCWIIDRSISWGKLAIEVGVHFDRDGKVEAQKIELIKHKDGSKDLALKAFDTARRAILRCQKDGFDLPKANYDQWKYSIITFDLSNF